jgi:hypothetical protein
MYSLALFIVELQTAKRRLIAIFEEPHDTSKGWTLPFTRHGEYSREEQICSSEIISRLLPV